MNNPWVAALLLIVVGFVTAIGVIFGNSIYNEVVATRSDMAYSQEQALKARVASRKP